MEPKVAIIMGSDSDFPIVEKAANVLDDLKIPYTLQVLSAHRTPKELDEFIKEVDESEDYKVVIAGAGMSAALAGAIAAKTIKPVIGIPLAGSKLDGVDALLSTAQMPPGVPVACMSIDGTKNAALMAAEIIALTDADIKTALTNFRGKQRERVLNMGDLCTNSKHHYMCELKPHIL